MRPARKENTKQEKPRPTGQGDKHKKKHENTKSQEKIQAKNKRTPDKTHKTFIDRTEITRGRKKRNEKTKEDKKGRPRPDKTRKHQRRQEQKGKVVQEKKR